MDLLHAAQVCTHASVLYMFQYISFAFNCNVCRSTMNRAATMSREAAAPPTHRWWTSQESQLDPQPKHCHRAEHHHLQFTLSQLRHRTSHPHRSSHLQLTLSQLPQTHHLQCTLSRHRVTTVPTTTDSATSHHRACHHRAGTRGSSHHRASAE